MLSLTGDRVVISVIGLGFFHQSSYREMYKLNLREKRETDHQYLNPLYTTVLNRSPITKKVLTGLTL
jgi:hypothetical protein